MEWTGRRGGKRDGEMVSSAKEEEEEIILWTLGIALINRL
jgi:hypothetical protein